MAADRRRGGASPATAKHAGPPLAMRTPERKVSPYDKIKDAIASGELLPGTPLVETALAEWCQVSRTPIRESLMRLEQDGLVIRSDRGLVVRERSQEEILDIYEVRVILEGTAARMAAARRSAVDLINLRRAIEEMGKVEPGDERAMAASNRHFHHVLWRASHNESLIDLLTRLDFHIARYPATTLSQPGRWEEATKEHWGIVAAIEARNEEKAEELARRHFSEARDLRLVILAQEVR
jgi:DNA-binding GntR family transcriptional regulator